MFGLTATHFLKYPMMSATRSAWEEAYRFTATATTGSWSEALAPEGQRFYHLEWRP